MHGKLLVAMLAAISCHTPASAAAFTEVSSAPAGQQNLTVDSEVFGPQRNLTCIWFTNFENSNFTQCQDDKSELLQRDESASLRCLRDICQQLDNTARKLTGWKNPEAPWGTFTVKFTGRIGLHPRNKRYLGDGTRTVLIEEVTSVNVLSVLEETSAK